jgi:hypothetical protein
MLKEIKINVIDIEHKSSNNTELKYNFEEYKLYRKITKYINSIKQNFQRGSNLNLKPSIIKLSLLKVKL